MIMSWTTTLALHTIKTSNTLSSCNDAITLVLSAYVFLMQYEFDLRETYFEFQTGITQNQTQFIYWFNKKTSKTETYKSIFPQESNEVAEIE